MLAACEAGDVFALLEGAREPTEALGALYGAVREPWLTRALLMYHARTGSARALDMLARAPDAHARHLLDALAEQLRGEPPARHHALAALAPLVARGPPWLHRLPGHQAARDLLAVARREREPLPLLHALLALAALIPAAPALAAPHAPELAEALLRPAALDPQPPAAARDHLHLAQLALFRALYATHPCTLLDALRAECAAGAGRERPREHWERALAPLVESVRLHPALVIGSRQREADATRWARLEVHDVLAECRRLALPPRDQPGPRASSAAPSPAPPLPLEPTEPPRGSGAHAARAAAALRPGTEPWFGLSERCGAESEPHTPLPAEADAEPPEAAVEATPENTPAKETRAAFRFPGAESAAVRALGRRSQPPSPLRREGSPPATPAPAAGRLARVALDRAEVERRAADSPVPFAGGPPPAGAPLARPAPSRAPPALAPPPLNTEDREVVRLTARGAWTERPRRAPPAARACTRPRARRSASCPPRAPSTRTACVAVQTVTAWPPPHDSIITDLYRDMPEELVRKQSEERDSEPVAPCKRLDAYLTELYAGRPGLSPAPSPAELAEQLALAHAQLMYERWRRDAHAERNRRLLGRCRQMHSLELANAALRDRLRVVAHERDELADRLARARARSPPAPPAAEHEARLEAALAEERAARLQAEAALREAEAQRALDAAELQRSRGESFEAARHVEALSRAALAAERRAEHVRRLRRELLTLAEREARLTSAARAALTAESAAGEERVRREARERAAAARADADAATARAESALARAHELEAMLASRDALVAELKRAARAAAEEHAARQRALEDKYRALMRVVRAAEGHRLARLAGAPSPAASPLAAMGAGAGARGPPALADCSRVRRLLDREEEDGGGAADEAAPPAAARS